MLPNFPPLCKRLTPGPGYLEALCAENVDVIATQIDHIDGAGIVTKDGKRRDVDAILCATGFDTSFQGRFSVLGRGGLNLQERYRERAETYLSVCTDGFPNYFQSLGPNAGVGNGNLLIIIESIHNYVGQILQKLSAGNVKSVEPKTKAVKNFTDYCDAYFKRTVFSAECGSWYKSSPPNTSPEDRKNGRISALWPGSSIHSVKAFEKVRWEDYEMETADGNDFGWFGDGWSMPEKEQNTEGLSWYINGTRYLHEQLPNDDVLEVRNGETNGVTELNKGEVTTEVRLPDDGPVAMGT